MSAHTGFHCEKKRKRQHHRSFPVDRKLHRFFDLGLYDDRIYSRTWRIDRNIEQRKQFRNHRPWKYKFRITELLSGRRIRVWKASDVIDGNEWFLSGGRDRQRKTCDR